MAATHRAAHQTQPLDMPDQVRVRLEQPGGVRQAARRHDPRRARAARPQRGGGRVGRGDVGARVAPRRRQQVGAVEPARAVDVLGVLGEARPGERGGGAAVDGDVVVLRDGGEDAGGVPGCFSGGGAGALVSLLVCGHWRSTFSSSSGQVAVRPRGNATAPPRRLAPSGSVASASFLLAGSYDVLQRRVAKDC